eukprot:177062-Amphidinium_carterae.1
MPLYQNKTRTNGQSDGNFGLRELILLSDLGNLTRIMRRPSPHEHKHCNSNLALVSLAFEVWKELGTAVGNLSRYYIYCVIICVHTIRYRQPD